MKVKNKKTQKLKTMVRSKEQETIVAGLKWVSKLNENWGAQLGFQIFTTPLQRRKKSNLPDGVRISKIYLNRKKITVYKYGKSVRKVLMVHGWEGAATDFSHFFEPLSRAGYEVVAIDLPGHGASPFSQLNAVLASGIIKELEVGHGPFCAVIGHSFGAFSLGYALSQFPQFAGIPFVSIGAPSKLKNVLNNFASFIGLNTSQEESIKEGIEKRFNIQVEDFEQGKFIKDHEGPIMFIHDQNDRVVPVEVLNDVKEITNAPVFHITSGLGHNRILRDQDVVEKVKSFIDEFHASRFSYENAVKLGFY